MDPFWCDSSWKSWWGSECTCCAGNKWVQSLWNGGRFVLMLAHVHYPSESPLPPPGSYFSDRTYSCYWLFQSTRGIKWVFTWSLWSMIWSRHGKKGFGPTTERQRQTSKYMSSTTTPCMTSQHMGYFVAGVLKESSHAQHVRQLWSSFGWGKGVSIHRSTNIDNSSILTIRLGKTLGASQKVL